jgi:hypothetical protein
MSSYSEGQTHQLMEALELAGVPATDVTKLGQFGKKGLLEICLVLNGKAKIVRIAEELREKVKRVLKPFLTFTTGPTTKEQLVADIQANKNKVGMTNEVSGYAKSMMNDPNFTISEVLEEVSFVALAIGDDLGFTTNPQTTDFMTDEFCQKWSAENLDGYVIELCKSDDGPRIRKHWTHQQKNTVVWCFMNRLIDSDRNSHVWRLWCDSDGGRWLGGRWTGPTRRWNPNSRIVFRLRKITQNSVA